MRVHRFLSVSRLARVAGLLLGLTAGWAAPAGEPGSAPQEAAPPPAPSAAAPLDLDQVLAWAAPTERDLLHRQVDWHPAVIDGVLAAQAADRPLVLWLYFGGPLGDC